MASLELCWLFPLVRKLITSVTDYRSISVFSGLQRLVAHPCCREHMIICTIIKDIPVNILCNPEFLSMPLNPALCRLNGIFMGYRWTDPYMSSTS